MNKLCFLLSILLTLTACSSADTPPDENSLPPGIMEPVPETGAVADADWSPHIEKQQMPENMNE
ncbi:hypothetical protein [Necropsobacter massiliensis]|uniref:hypothetical protein n=1 Tax=Necropsobacter massiliensis TaxID=1400001 RepID=UPI0009E5FFC4|nr:hypothetical protein [Necropsobacter massiliensis]